MKGPPDTLCALTSHQERTIPWGRVRKFGVTKPQMRGLTFSCALRPL